VARRGVDVLEDLPERLLDLGLDVLWDLGKEVCGEAEEAALTQVLGEELFGSADEPPERRRR
jgi:hypothetical protein